MVPRSGDGHPEQPALEGAHRGFLLRLGVIEATDVERAVGDEQPELLRGGPADIAGVAAAAGLGLLAGALDGDHEVAKMQALTRRPRVAARRGLRPPAVRSGRNASGGNRGNDNTSVGPVLPMCVALSSASSASSERTSPIEAGAGTSTASSAAVMARASEAIETGAWTASRTTTSTRHGGR